MSIKKSMAFYILIERFLHHRLVVFFVAFLYAYFLMSLPLDAFKDREYYFAYTRNAEYLFNYNLAGGFLKFFSNEPLWLSFNLLASYFFSAKEIVQFVIFAPAFIVSYKLLSLRKYSFFIILFILISPQIVKNHIIHLRQGFALAIFLLGWFSYKKRFLWLIYLTPFVHSSFFFLILLYVIAIIQKKFAFNVWLSLVFFGVAGIALGLVFNQVAGVLGARQALSEGYANTGGSGLALIFWAAVLLIYLFQGKQFIRDHLFEIGALVFYLMTYFLAEVSARIFESALVLVVLTGLDLTKWRKILFIIMLVFYCSLLYWKVIDEPWLGFEVEQELYWQCPESVC